MFLLTMYLNMISWFLPWLGCMLLFAFSLVRRSPDQNTCAPAGCRQMQRLKEELKQKDAEQESSEGSCL